jgi:3-oxoacyl-[acyl-carrier-protein] synthase III
MTGTIGGNATYRPTNTAVLSVSAVDATRVVTSAELDDRLEGTYRRVRLRPGLMERLAGIYERRWWADGVTFADGAAMAGAKALAESGVDPSQVGLMVNTSVSRAFLEPATAVGVHDSMGLPTTCLNYDISNACLGFVNGMQLAAAMIDAGQVDYVLLVDGEDARTVQDNTIARLSGPEVTARDVMAEFATLTLGSGAAAMVLGPADRHPEGHRIIGGVSRAGTEHNELCVGDLDMMRTDSKGLLDAGLDLSAAMWADAGLEFDWTSGMDRYFIHQISEIHTEAICHKLRIDPDRVPRTFPTRGNIGPASIPFTLATHAGELEPGHRVLLMGIGSGLNTSCTEIRW